MAQFGNDIEEDLKLLDVKIKQCKNEYEQYFLGSRPREPSVTRAEVQKMIALYAQVAISNTGHRFKFNNLRARYFSFRRHWDETLRKIEQGTYERHLFKARLHERKKPEPAAASAAPGGGSGDSIYDAYVSARQACGQDTRALSPEKLAAILKKQEQQIRAKLGCAGVGFKVVVEDGKAKLKAIPKRSA